MELEIFSERKLVVATMHEKERLIGPLLSSFLGIDYTVPKNFDTDQFGAFSGEVKREGTALETARRKCEVAMEVSGCDLAVASEGSFGQHPEAFGLAINEEFLLLLDKKHGLEIIEKEISTETNFSSAYCNSLEELKAFAEKAGFPNHGLILRDREASETMIKGIRSLEVLNSAFDQLSDASGRVWVETDMRAMHNPRRREVISRAAEKLAKRCSTYCPVCSLPGFGVTNSVKGLPCLQCQMPTKSVGSHILSCVACDHTETIPIESKKFEDPMFCDFCNP